MAPTAHELEEQIALRRQRFQKVIEEIRALLREDLPGWTQRTVKAAFLNAGERATELSDDKLKALKKRAAELGPALAEQVDAALSDEAKWLDGPQDSEERRSLEYATGVWPEVDKAAAAVGELLEEFGIAGEEPPRYKAPMYFVGGKYFPALAEHYWRLVAEMRELESEREQASADDLRDNLLDRWEKA